MIGLDILLDTIYCIHSKSSQECVIVLPEPGQTAAEHVVVIQEGAHWAGYLWLTTAIGEFCGFHS